ncbi:hypothetical protein [Carnobacterium antarcticum]|uniref:Uncharacterized protein n=1 Tax=Carnobacterium antarcticum TaxID=2126436 RepID=A0ABW4NKZ0_9LACT|nr:hypothetical protein [Carnobacterium sp. CP1]ALV21946.1 hypothetical protein NY10_1338 [Carnobacterium sp. CP1]
MDKEHLLTTKITISGTFQDFQLYSGKFYLWTTKNELNIYNWNKWMQQLTSIDRPIYFEPQPTEQLTIKTEELEPFRERTVLFTEPLYDSVIFNHVLYYSDPSGFYRYSLMNKEAEKELIYPLPVFQINLSSSGRMALAAGEKGLFEYLVSHNYLFQQTKHALTPRLFQLSSTYTSRTEWLQQDLIQYGDPSQQETHLLRFVSQKGVLSLTYILPLNQTANDSPLQIRELPLALSFNRPSMNDGSLFAFETDKYKVKKNPFYRSQTIHLLTASHPLSENQATDPDALVVSERNKQLSVTLQDDPILSLPSSTIKKWRIYSRTRYYRNQLHLLFPHELVLYLFTEVKR